MFTMCSHLQWLFSAWVQDRGWASVLGRFKNSIGEFDFKKTERANLVQKKNRWWNAPRAPGRTSNLTQIQNRHDVLFDSVSYCNHLYISWHIFTIRTDTTYRHIENLWEYCTYVTNHCISIHILIAHFGSPQKSPQRSTKFHKTMRSAQVIHTEDPHGAIEALARPQSSKKCKDM